MAFLAGSKGQNITFPTAPMMTMTKFFHADPKINVHPLPVWWYFISIFAIDGICVLVHIVSKVGDYS